MKTCLIKNAFGAGSGHYVAFQEELQLGKGSKKSIPGRGLLGMLGAKNNSISLYLFRIGLLNYRASYATTLFQRQNIQLSARLNQTVKLCVSGAKPRFRLAKFKLGETWGLSVKRIRSSGRQLHDEFELVMNIRQMEGLFNCEKKACCIN